MLLGNRSRNNSFNNKQMSEDKDKVNLDDEDLIVRPIEPSFESKGFSFGDDSGVLIKQPKQIINKHNILPSNRNFKNNLNIEPNNNIMENIFRSSKEAINNRYSTEQPEPLENIIDIPKEEEKEEFKEKKHKKVKRKKQKDIPKDDPIVEPKEQPVEPPELPISCEEVNKQEYLLNLDNEYNRDILRRETFKENSELKDSDFLYVEPMFNNTNFNKKIFRTCYVVVVICLVIFGVILYILTSFRNYIKEHEDKKENNLIVLEGGNGEENNENDILKRFYKNQEIEPENNQENIPNNLGNIPENNQIVIPNNSIIILPNNQEIISGIIPNNNQEVISKTKLRDAKGRFIKTK